MVAKDPVGVVEDARRRTWPRGRTEPRPDRCCKQGPMNGRGGPMGGKIKGLAVTAWIRLTAQTSHR